MRKEQENPAVILTTFVVSVSLQLTGVYLACVWALMPLFEALSLPPRYAWLVQILVAVGREAWAHSDKDATSADILVMSVLRWFFVGLASLVYYQGFLNAWLCP